MSNAAERAIESELSPAAILYVLRLLKNCFDYSARRQILHDFNLFRDMEQFGVPNENQAVLVLIWLRQKGIISYRNYSETSDNPWIRAEFDKRKPPDSTYVIEIINPKKLMELFREVTGSQVEEAKENIDICTFDVDSGIGYLNGERFAVPVKSREVFNEFYEDMGNWCRRNRILKLIDDTIDPKSKNSTIILNTFITNLRKSTKFSKLQLEIKYGNVRLNTRRQLTDQLPKPT